MNPDAEKKEEIVEDESGAATNELPIVDFHKYHTSTLSCFNV